MKVILLDHYGVMCRASPGTIRTRTSLPTSEELQGRLPWEPFDPACVSILNDILATTLADIVIASDWKHSKNLSDIGDFYAAHGVIKRPIDVTSDVNGNFERYAMRRTAEIQQWVTHNDVTAWCAVDDLWMELDCFVWAQDPHAAITAPGLADQIISTLMATY